MVREYRIKSPFAQSEAPTEPEITSSPSEPKALTVTELTRQIQGVFENNFSSGVWVEGELSEPKIYPSGHLWFSLKDEQSTLKSVMWRDDVRGMKFDPEQGLQVICYGKVDFYAPRGEVKFVVRSIEPKGMGALQLAFDQMVEKLEKKGFFAPEHKQSLPVFPERIGLVTSPKGAAIDDMLKLLRGHVEVVLAPARVQGGPAAEAIVSGIEALNKRKDLDLLIVGRGGGSLEDLWAFNEEEVAEAVFHSEIPVVSAVGHEKDISISDLTADVRATTPTNAAEIVLNQRARCLDRLERVLENPAFTEPETWLETLEERIVDLETALAEGLQDPLLEATNQIRVLHHQLMGCSPQAYILHQAERVHRLQGAMKADMMHGLEQLTAQVHGLAGRLNALSPLAVLDRGYSITFDNQNQIIKDTKKIKTGDTIQTQLHQGKIKSRVEGIER